MESLHVNMVLSCLKFTWRHGNMLVFMYFHIIMVKGL